MGGYLLSSLNGAYPIGVAIGGYSVCVMGDCSITVMNGGYSLMCCDTWLYESVIVVIQLVSCGYSISVMWLFN